MGGMYRNMPYAQKVKKIWYNPAVGCLTPLAATRSPEGRRNVAPPACLTASADRTPGIARRSFRSGVPSAWRRSCAAAS